MTITGTATNIDNIALNSKGTFEVVSKQFCDRDLEFKVTNLYKDNPTFFGF